VQAAASRLDACLSQRKANAFQPFASQISSLEEKQGNLINEDWFHPPASIIF
jgi:hypothetical protein